MAVYSIASIFLLRMLGLFMLLPIFREYAMTLQGVSKPLMGITIGIYGLTQAVFQIPFGFFSDRWGRRAVITWGLFLFIAGSIVVAQSTHLYGVTMGRALQGTGAIGSVLMVYLSDLIREVVRPRAMAWVGMVIGISFVLALMLAPLLSSYWGVPALFWGMGAAGIVALLILYRGLPNSSHASRLMMSDLRKQGVILFKQRAYLGALLAIFFLHSALTALFLFLPQWIQQHGFTDRQSWHFYLPVFLIGFSGAMQIIRWTEKKQQLQKTVQRSMLWGALMLLLLAIGHDYRVGLWLGTTGFFMAFGFLEAGLPAFVSTIVDKSIKGTAMGIYATSQFLGIFFGGLVGGLLLAM
jgi:predicted MFS family arabinose efflux permease